MNIMPYHRDMNKEYGEYSKEPLYYRWNPFLESYEFWSELTGQWYKAAAYVIIHPNSIELRYQDTWCEPVAESIFI